MPYGDGTGPMWYPWEFRTFSWCRCGRGFWWRAFGIPGWITATQELEILKKQAQIIQNQLNLINERIKAIEKSEEK